MNRRTILAGLLLAAATAFLPGATLHAAPPVLAKPEAVELAKDEALNLMRAHFNVLILENSLAHMNNRQQDLVRGLQAKYKLASGDYIFDVSVGAFITRAAAELRQAGKPIPPEAAKTVDVAKDDALPVINLQYALQSTAADLKQAYVQREQLLAALHQKNQLDPADYVADVFNGRLVRAQRPAAPPPPPPAAKPDAAAAAPKKP
ncbi:MAG: hypothetical protein WC789_01800 [Lentisphaeria bacterium]|jgi:hypothetical protein